MGIIATGEGGRGLLEGGDVGWNFSSGSDNLTTTFCVVFIRDLFIQYCTFLAE